MSKVKKQTKQHLIIEKQYKTPLPKECDVESILNMLYEKAKQKQTRFGLNTVFKAANKDELKLAVVPRTEEYNEAYQPLFNVIAKKHIPILSLDIDDFNFAQRFHGMKKLLVLGLLCDIPEQLKDYLQYLNTSNDLPPVTLEVDTYSVEQSKLSKRRN